MPEITNQLQLSFKFSWAYFTGMKGSFALLQLLKMFIKNSYYIST